MLPLPSPVVMLFLALVAAYPVAAVAAVALNLCLSENLGSDLLSNHYMSNGLCKTTCSGLGYVVAITQNYDCWCLNDVPDDTVSLDNCDIGCPGYSDQENCGGNGYYGYVILDTPSATVGASGAVQPLTADLGASESAAASNSPESAPDSDSPTTTRTSSRSSSRTSLTSSASSRSSARTSSSASSSATSPPSSLAFPSAGASLASSGPTRTSNGSSLATGSLSVAASPSVRATTVVSVTTVDGSPTQIVLTKYVTQVASASTSHQAQSKSFFDSAGKVAGTFTAVGVVVVAAVSTLIYCCCFGAGRHSDAYSDEENQYLSDEASVANEKTPRGLKRSLQGSGILDRNNSSKSILSFFAPAGGAAVGRSSLRKKLNPSLTSGDTGPMFPIHEFDNRLDPATMFQTQNESKMSLADEQDYSRRILHVANPEV